MSLSRKAICWTLSSQLQDDINGEVPKTFLVVLPECKKERENVEEDFEFIDKLPMTRMRKVDYRELESRIRYFL